MRFKSSRNALPLLLWALILTATSGCAGADDNVWLTGHVINAGGAPAVGAIVAVYDDANRVVDHAKTDAHGDYAMAVPKRVVHLDRQTKGFFATVVGSVTRVVGGAALFVADPLRAGVHAAAGAIAVADPLARGGVAAGGVAADQVLNVVAPPRHGGPAKLEDRKQPGALVMKVVTPGDNDLVSVAHVYWVQEELFKTGHKEERSLSAWIDPVQMTSSESEKPSVVESKLLKFTHARLMPSIAEPGQRVRLTVRMDLPVDPPINVVVVARDASNGKIWELAPKGDGVYEGEIDVDKRFKRDDQPISVLAYAALQQKPGRRPDAEKAIEAAGLWDPKRPFKYDPALVASRSRADVTLTVVIPDGKKR